LNPRNKISPVSLTIAIDAMGGDHGPKVTVPATLSCLREYPELQVILVGDQAQLEAELPKTAQPEFTGRITLRHASQRVEMDDSPAKALRNKKDSSMRVAINLVHEGVAQACVSAGNTGALMATAKFVLKTLPGIDRPAIISKLPSLHGHTHILDLGANVDCSAEHLFQFGVMGSELVRALENVEQPRVALLNIGEEEIKGNEQVKAAAKLLENSYLNYIGYVEGDSINAGPVKVDVIVTDGFVGNVALKSIEGVAKMIAASIKDGFNKHLGAQIAGLIAYPVLKAIKRHIDPRNYNGASLLGLQGIVIKSHGSADAWAFTNAIRIAKIEVEKNVIGRISERIATILSERERTLT